MNQLQLNNMSEGELADIATFHEDDKLASEAMKLLRQKFNPSYHWCPEFDGLAMPCGNECQCK